MLCPVLSARQRSQSERVTRVRMSRSPLSPKSSAFVHGEGALSHLYIETLHVQNTIYLSSTYLKRLGGMVR